MAVHSDHALSLTQRWVKINSILPHEDALAGAVAEEIRTAGLEPRWQEVSPGRRNVWVQAELGPKPVLVTLTGHLDTVQVADGWQTDPFDPVIRDGRLYGLGSVDMKSGLACAWVAFRRLLEGAASTEDLGTIGFAATVDEEGLGTGARELLKTPLGRSDLILLTEPFHGEVDPVPLVMPGKVLYRIVLRGKSSHALMNPEQGINAIDDAARIVGALDRLPLGTHPALGRVNYSVLKIEGGYRQYATIVPEHCEIVVTRLLVPGETRDSAVRDLEALIATLRLASRVTVDTLPPYYDPYQVSPDHLGVQAFVTSYRRRFGRDPMLGGLLGITDANIYSGEAGIPTVTFGPKGAGLHECQEYVEVDSLGPVVDVLVDTAVEFMRRS